jgi:hypothetical protein
MADPSGQAPAPEPSMVARCPWCSQVLPSPPPDQCPNCGARLTEEGELDASGTFHLTSPPADRTLSKVELEALAPETPLSPEELLVALAPPSEAVAREMTELAQSWTDHARDESPVDAAGGSQPPAGQLPSDPHPR